MFKGESTIQLGILPLLMHPLRLGIGTWNQQLGYEDFCSLKICSSSIEVRVWRYLGGGGSGASYSL